MLKTCKSTRLASGNRGAYGKSNNNRSICINGAMELYQYASAEIHGAQE